LLVDRAHRRRAAAGALLRPETAAGGKPGAALERLQAELARRGIRFRPHTWLAEEWFSPDGVPGFAIPFYLAHPRLAQLERRQMGEVEGGNNRWLMRILRHETGHAIDTAYRLRRRKRYRQVFGAPSREYPTTYVTRPGSRNFVLHLGHWYAQSHPTEDFAETFAVWLPHRSTWKTDYADWPARRKLGWVDDVMAEIGAAPAPVQSRRQVEPLASNRRTLKAHYKEKLQYSPVGTITRHDQRLRRVFAPRVDHRGAPPAATFLRQVKPQHQTLLMRRAPMHPYMVYQVMRLVTRRVAELDLCVHKPLRWSKRASLVLQERILFDLVRRGRERFAL
jgi:Putative zinc-binding metallo-peptidase